MQESVFECRLTPVELPALLARLEATLGSPDAGQVRVYRVCSDCLSASVGIGATAGPSTACYVV